MSKQKSVDRDTDAALFEKVKQVFAKEQHDYTHNGGPDFSSMPLALEHDGSTVFFWVIVNTRLFTDTIKALKKLGFTISTVMADNALSFNVKFTK